MKILISQGYRKSQFLIENLDRVNHQISFMHEEELFATKIARKYQVKSYVGSLVDVQLLRDCQANQFDVIVLLSSSDAMNFVSVKLINKYLKVKKIICLLTSPSNEVLYEDFKNVTVISSSHLINDILTATTNLNDLHEIKVKLNKHSKMIGKEILSFISEEIRICYVIRNNQSFIPKRNDQFVKGDELIVCSSLKYHEVIKVFNE